MAVLLAIHSAKDGDWSLQGIGDRLPDTSVRDRLNKLAALSSGTTVMEVATRFGTSGFVVDSVPFALFSTRRVSQIGFSEMLKQIIAAGGDTDTNASIAGQVAGTSLGLQGFPKEWLNKLPQAGWILAVAQRFAKSVAERAG